VDHRDLKAGTMEFEIVSWLINDCKAGLALTSSWIFAEESSFIGEMKKNKIIFDIPLFSPYI
jgi:hypothetical protein